jgi:hypothetical protein
MLSHLATLLFVHFDQLLLPGAHKHFGPTRYGPNHTRDDEPVMPSQSLLLGEFGAEIKGDVAPSPRPSRDSQRAATPGGLAAAATSEGREFVCPDLRLPRSGPARSLIDSTGPVSAGMPPRSLPQRHDQWASQLHRDFHYVDGRDRCSSPQQCELVSALWDRLSLVSIVRASAQRVGEGHGLFRDPTRLIGCSFSVLVCSPLGLLKQLFLDYTGS